MEVNASSETRNWYEAMDEASLDEHGRLVRKLDKMHREQIAAHDRDLARYNQYAIACFMGALFAFSLDAWLMNNELLKLVGYLSAGAGVYLLVVRHAMVVVINQAAQANALNHLGLELAHARFQLAELEAWLRRRDR